MIGLFGINYKTAPIHIREEFSFNEERINSLLDEIKATDVFSEMLILSTCNRTEFVFDAHVSVKACKYALTEVLGKRIPSIKSYADCFYFYVDARAIRHFYKVVSGLDSMIIGEYQIVGQMKEAFAISRENEMTGKVLTRLCDKALETGKIIRSNTAICEGATSVSYAAVEKTAQLFPAIKKLSVLLVGAGETGELTLKNFIKKECVAISIANRTHEKAEELAAHYNGKLVLFEELGKRLGDFDVVIASTAAGSCLITKDMVLANDRKAMTLFIDLSVPRNIDEGINELDHCTLLNIDDLQNAVEGNYEKRKQELDKAEIVIQEMTDDFMEWQKERNLVPTIESIKKSFLDVNAKELNCFLKKKSPETQLEVEKYGNYLSAKYSRLLIKNLKEVTDNGENTEYLEIINKLFSIN